VDNGPDFDLFPDGAPSKPKTLLSESTDNVRFSSGNLSVDLNTSAYSYGLTFSDNSGPSPKVLTSTEPKGQAVVDVPYHLTLSQMSSLSVLSTIHDTMAQTDNTTAGQRTGGGWVRFMLNEFVLGVGETIYGLGERFGPYVKNGQNIGIWNQDE
jgi:alpha-glucosidase (family GH31 glycosyl hydrolase)